MKQHLNLFLKKCQGCHSVPPVSFFLFEFEFGFYSKGLVERVTAALILCVCVCVCVCARANRGCMM